MTTGGDVVAAGVLTLALVGDVMLARGIDQILANPGDPVLRERFVTDARDYVRLAERVNGPIPRPVDGAWPWGEALRILDEAAPVARIVNLETAVTRSDDFAPGKAVHYRTSPDDLASLLVARPDACVLANNHVLDLGRRGLTETLEVLASAGLANVGAGRDLEQAQRPVAIPVPGGERVLVHAWGLASSGVPPGWAATPDRPGVAFLDEPSDAAAREVLDQVERHRRPGDVVVVSLHWGPNWGYEVTPDEVDFAHALVDGGVDVVHGHSSHHPRPIEVHRDRPILYGCGDFIDDYEGITGHERFRPDLRLLYLVSLVADTGALVGVRIVPFQARRMRLEHASAGDTRWVRDVLDRVSRPFGASIAIDGDGPLTLERH